MEILPSQSQKSSQFQQNIRRQDRQLAAWTIGIFAIVSLIGILRHEMWRDELYAWMLARESSSLAELLFKLRHEGHPALWHLCLYGLQGLSQNPIIMQIFHWEIAVVNIVLLNGYAPFRRSHKILLSFSYFFLYEYALLSRNYSLSVLFLFLFCAIYTSARLRGRRLYVPALALSLVALAHTTAFGLLLSFALSLLVWIELWTSPRTVTPWLQRLLLPAALLLGGWGLSLMQITQPLWRTGAFPNETRLAAGAVSDLGTMRPMAALLPDHLALEPMEIAKRLAYTLVQIWKAYVPIPPLGETNFWNLNFLVDSELLDLGPSLPLGLGLGILLSGLLCAWSVWRLRRSRLTQLLYISGVGLLYAFSFNFFWWGSQRHHGYLWLLFVACLWLLPTVGQRESKRGESGQRESGRKEFGEKSGTHPGEATGSSRSANADSHPSQSWSQPWPKFWRDGFTWLLILQAVAGCYFYSVDFLYPFATGQSTAEFIRRNQLDQLTLVAMRDRPAASVSAYLNRPLFYPELNRYGTHWTIYQPPSTPEQVATRIDNLANRSAPDLLLILNEPLDDLGLPLVGTVQPITSFEAIVDDDESFYLYRYSDR